MKIAYSVFLALAGQDFEVDAESITSNSDCGKLNLLCSCCHERVYWVNRNKQKFFSHFPNSKQSENCENFTNKLSKEQKKKSILSALNKEKTQYEKHFWKIITSVYSVWNKYAEFIKDLENTPEVKEAFETFYYPQLLQRKPQLLQLLGDIYVSKIELNGYDENENKRKPKSIKIYELVMQKNTKQFREVVLSLLFDFLCQKRSRPIVFKFYVLAVILVYEKSGFTLPKPNWVTDFALNMTFNMLCWLPWEECLNDIQSFGKVLLKHCYEEDFVCFMIAEMAPFNEDKKQCVVTIN